MQVFKISGKFEQYGNWSSREADFTGYFVKRESDVIEGYMEELYGSSADIRYINGLFIDGIKLVFLKMTNALHLSPLVYHFPNINETGFWSGFSFFNGFCYQGHAEIKLEEITSDSEKEELANKVSTVFYEHSANAHSLNRELMSDVESLADILNWKPTD